MKYFLILFFLFTTLIFETKAINDTLLIKMQSGIVKKIVISELQSITFPIIEKNAIHDTLLLKIKSGVVEKMAISELKKITFEFLTDVDEIYSKNTNLSTKGNYPNPFFENTTIEFEIVQSGNVIINIYDNLGNQIQTLNCENCASGINTLEWNGFDNNNNRVHTGIYFYDVIFNKEVQSKKMIMVR